MTSASAGSGGHPPAAAPTASDEHVELLGAATKESRDTEFVAFVRTHEVTLLRTAWLLVGDRHQAEELTQRALVRTYAAWSRARTPDPLAYTRRVLVNLRTDTWRRRRREVLMTPQEVPEDASPAGAAHPGPTPELLVDREVLVRALAGLTTRQRRIVVLRYVLDLSEETVAADLGVSRGTVKSTASRALATLRGTLGTDTTHGDPR